MVHFEHIDAAVEVGDIHLSAAGDSLAVNLLANEVEELDVRFFIVAKVNRELVGGRVRINGEVVFLDFRNVDDAAVVAGHAKGDPGFRVATPEEVGLINIVEVFGGDVVVGGGSSSGDSQWVNASKVTVESSDGTTVTTYYYDADGLLLKSEAQYTCYSDATKNCTTTTTNSYDSDGTITKVSVEAVHANAPDEDTRSDTRYGYINFLGKKFLATEVVEKYSRQNGGWVKDDTIVTTKNPTGRGQGAASDSKGNVSASGNRGDDRVSPFYSDDNLLDDMDEDNSGDEYDTTTQSRDIDGLTLFDTSFPIQNITRARFENLPFPPIGLTEEDIQNIDTAKGQGRLIELTEKIKWLNRKTKETITLLVYDVPHLIDFTDRIRFCGNEYYLVENTARAQSRLRNEQNLTLVRWF